MLFAISLIFDELVLVQMGRWFRVVVLTFDAMATPVTLTMETSGLEGAVSCEELHFGGVRLHQLNTGNGKVSAPARPYPRGRTPFPRGRSTTGEEMAHASSSSSWCGTSWFVCVGGDSCRNERLTYWHTD